MEKNHSSNFKRVRRSGKRKKSCMRITVYFKKDKIA